MGASDAVEATCEEGAGDVLLVSLAILHGLVVRRHGEVDMVVLEVDTADLRVEVVARVADEPPRLGSPPKDDLRS